MAAAKSGGGGSGVVSELKARLGPEVFALLHAVSMRYQREEAMPEEYYQLALDILQGDAASLLRLVDKLPDGGKREAVKRCHAEAMAQLEEQLLIEEQLSAAAASAAAAGHVEASRAGLSGPAGSGVAVVGSTVWEAASEAASEAAGGQLLQGQVFVDEDDEAFGEQEERLKLAGVGIAHSGGSAHGNRHMVNLFGQPLCQVITEFSPPWQEAKSGASQGPRPTYQQLAAARREGGTAGDGKPAAVPTSTPWVQEQLPSSRINGAGTGSGSGFPGTGGAPTAAAQRLASLSLSASLVGSASGAASNQTSRSRPVIVWYRRDLRVADNPALHHAAASGRPVLPVFIWAPQESGRWVPGGATQHWMHHSLTALDAELRRRYGEAARLRCFDARGSSSGQVLHELIQATQAAEVVWNRLYEPWFLTRDAEVELSLTGHCQLATHHLLPYHTRPKAPPAAAAASASVGGAGGAGAGTAGGRGVGQPGVVVHSFNGSLLYEPWDAAPDMQDEAWWNGGYGSVGFFLSSCQRLGEPPEPLPAPARMAALPATSACPRGCSIAALGLGDLPSVGPQQAQRTARPLGSHDWAAGIRDTWRFGEAAAAAALEEFLEHGLQHFDARSEAKTIQSQRYEEEDSASLGANSGASRDGRPGRSGRPPAPPSERFRADRKFTARISPYLTCGELSPRQVYHATLQRHGPRRAKTFLRRLAWRDLAYWALWRFPWLPDEPLRPQYAAQGWELGWRGEVELGSLHTRFRRWCPDNPRLLAWQRGRTGFPLVDAGMRELWASGYIPNYVRHIVAGFLIEYLNIDWRHGCLWFHDTLVDADVAINAMMWQNGGHSGMDQWNFVLGPVAAAKAADPDGDYVRRWCPELSRLPVPWVHMPWEAPATVLAAAGVTLGRHYPRPVIADLEAARRASLAAVVSMRRTAQGRRYILPDGNDALPLPDGRFARAITRVDYRQMAEQPVTKQATADLWDKGRRPLRDPMAAAMHETLRGSLGPGQAAGGRRMG